MAILRAEELELRYQGEVLFDGVSLQLEPGRLTVLHGPSGSGKSSLLWVLSRMRRPDAGRLWLGGEAAATVPVREWRRRTGLVPQQAVMIPGTVRQNLLLSARWGALPGGLALLSQQCLPFWRSSSTPGEEEQKAEEYLRHELHTLGLEELKLEDEAANLSGGQTSRLSLLRTLLTEPDCLLLDEPFAALDPDTTAQVQRRLQRFLEEKGALLIVSHQPVDGANFARPPLVLSLKEGRLHTSPETENPQDKSPQGHS